MTKQTTIVNMGITMEAGVGRKERKAKEIIRNEKQLMTAVVKYVHNPETIAAIAKAVNDVYAERLNIWTGKAIITPDDENRYFAIKFIVAEAVRRMQYNGLVEEADALQTIVDTVDLQGKFKVKGFKFIAVSTVVFEEDAMVETTDGKLMTKEVAGFDVQPLSLFTRMLIKFLGKEEKYVSFRYEKYREGGEQKVRAVMDATGAYKAIDLRREIIVCENVGEVEVAQRAIVEGFYVKVEGLPLVQADYEYKSAAQGRVSKWVSGELIKNGERIAFTDFLVDAGLNLLTLAKKKYGVITSDLMKDPTRAPLLAGTGRFLNTMTHIAKGLTVSKRGNAIIMMNKKMKLAILPDVEVVINKGTYYVLDKATGHTILEKEASAKEIRQVFNDGVTLIDADFYRRYIAPELGYRFLGENSFRMSSGLIKGALVPVEGLAMRSGVDLLSTEGNAKAKAALIDGQVFNPEFNVIIEKDADKSYKVERRWIPYQVLATSTFKRQALLDVLASNINDYKTVVESFGDSPLFKAMFGSFEEDMEREASSLWNTVLKALDANRGFHRHPYISYGIAQMLEFYADNLRAGKLQTDSSYRLMVQDIELFSYILEHNLKAEMSGIEGVYEITRNSAIVEQYIQEHGAVIEAGQVVLARGNGKGCFTQDILAFRFPLTHSLQGVKIQTVMIPHYDKAISKRLYRSLIQFSAFDAILIGMAGADCDGDQCLVIFDQTLVEGYEHDYAINRVKVLDKHINEFEEVIDGVPWKNVERLDFDLPEGFSYDLDEHGEGNAFGVRIDERVFNALSTHEVERVLHEVNKRVSARTIQSANIGKFTNIIMRMLQVVEDLRSRAATGFRGFYNINREPLAIEYPEYMGTRLDQTGSLVQITFSEWAEEQANLIENDALGWQWVLQYELDKNKHGGAFYEAMAALIDLQDNPREGSRIFMGVNPDGSIIWAQNEETEKYLFRQPTWLVSEKALTTNPNIRVMHTNIDVLRMEARKHLRSVDNGAIYGAMSNISEIAKEFAHYESNHNEVMALADEVRVVYAQYNQVVSQASQMYQANVAGLANYLGMPVARVEAGHMDARGIEQLDQMKQQRQSLISNAIDVASMSILFLESKYANALEDSTKAILAIAYDLVHSALRIRKNVEDFSNTQNAYDLVKGMSFFWNACMSQIAKAQESPLYAEYARITMEKVNYQPMDFNAELQFAIACPSLPDFAERMVNATMTGHTVELIARNEATTITPDVFVDYEGNRVQTPGVQYNEYALYLTLNSGAELKVGSLHHKCNVYMNSADEVKLSVAHAEITGGQSVKFVKSHNVSVIK